MSAERDAGFAAFQRGDYPTAVASLEQAVQQDPNDYDAHLYLGAAYGQTERNTEAITALTQAVTLQPANPMTRFNLAVALERGGWLQEALTAFQQAVTLKPDYVKAQEAINRLQLALAVGNGTAVVSTPTFAPAQPALDLSTPQNHPSIANSPQPLYSAQSAIPAAYGPPPGAIANGATGVQPANVAQYGSPAPAYGAPNQPTPFVSPSSRPLTHVMAPSEPKIGMALAVAFGMILLCGLGFGFASLAIGIRIPFLTIAIGYLMGYAVAKTCMTGPAQGAIAAVGAILATGLGLGVMYLGGLFLSPVSFLLVGYAGFRAYKIASGS